MSLLSQFADTINGFLHSLGDWGESRLDVETRLDTVQRKERQQQNKAEDKVVLVGKAAELVLQQLAAAEALERRQVSAIEFQAREATKAQTAGDEAKQLHHVQTGQILASQLAQTRGKLAKLRIMASEAVEGKEEIYNEVLRQARNLSMRWTEDEMTVLEYRMADGRDEMTKLQKMVIDSLEPNHDNARARLKDAVSDRVAETNARSDFYKRKFAQVTELEDAEDEKIAIEGEDLFKQIAEGVGYTPKALPAGSTQS